MLGRLEMDVDECISAYNRLMEVVFKDKTHILPLKWTGRVQSRFDSAKLRDAIDDVITKQGYSPAEPFNDGKARGCRVYVSFRGWTAKRMLTRDLALFVRQPKTSMESHAFEVTTSRRSRASQLHSARLLLLPQPPPGSSIQFPSVRGNLSMAHWEPTTQLKRWKEKPPISGALILATSCH